MMGEPYKLEHRGGELVALRGNQVITRSFDLQLRLLTTVAIP
jgi:hypothetical protein